MCRRPQFAVKATSFSTRAGCQEPGSCTGLVSKNENKHGVNHNERKLLRAGRDFVDGIQTVKSWFNSVNK